MNWSVVARHVLAVLAAASSAVVLYVLGHHVLGIEVETAEVDPPRVTLASVLGTSSVAAALGWALLSGLESWVPRGRLVWTWVAVGVTALSLLGPLTTPDLTGGGRVLLSVLHVAVGAVTIAALLAGPGQPRRSSSATRRDPAVLR